MPTTPTYALPYPVDADVPDGPAQIRALAEKLDQVIAAQAIVPPASIVPTMAVAAPTGWLMCDGALKQRSDFVALANAMGVPAGNTTFNLPNLRGRAPVGLDAAQPEFDTLGEQTGLKVVTLTEAEMPYHDHPLTGSGFQPRQSGVLNGFYNQYAANPGYTAVDGWAGATLQQHGWGSGARGGSQPHTNVQPSTVVNFIIKT